VIAIGDNLGGEKFWLKCTGEDAGHVYIFDNQFRSAWTDERFFQMFPNLHPDIRKYLELRRQGKLPKKAQGYEHIYRVATSFSEFISRPGEWDWGFQIPYLIFAAVLYFQARQLKARVAELVGAAAQRCKLTRVKK